MADDIQTLRSALFAQLHRLQDPNCNIEKETMRANALTAVSGQIVATGRLQLEFAKLTGNAESDFINNKQIEDGGKRNKKA